MSDKTKAAIPVAVGAVAITLALALGSMDDTIVVEVHKDPTPYSDAHSRVQGSGAPAEEQPPTF